MAYTQPLNNKNQASFNPIGASFSPNYFDTLHPYITSIAFGLYATHTVSIPPI